ncbi:MAG: hypothetical protein FJX89_08245 [Bacteroidetes bacterium]|nr:hypothetical protein [Bacteroidota bacterium]
MRTVMISLLSLSTSTAIAQPRMVEKAIIRFKTEVTFPENFGNNTNGPEGGGQMMMGGGMEASSTLYVSGMRSKMESNTDFGNNIVITDKTSGRTTNLTETMGRKTGFFSTPEDEQVMRARMDSMRNARRNEGRDARRDSLQRAGFSFGAPARPEIEYTEETKKIAGLTCRKAIIRTRGQRGQPNESIIWYSPDFKMPEGLGFPGGESGFGGGGRSGMMSLIGIPGLNELPGFPMEFQVERGNGFKTHTMVTKVQLDASIDPKTFEIPKGFDIKPMSEMQNERGMMMMRMGRN